jgi:hypothetical protein
MKHNTLAALLLLLLGAALAEWLSTRDAHAQAFPPASSGGTSYTHPSAISLSNGINSADGGAFNGPVYLDDGIAIDGGAGIQFLGPAGGAGAPYLFSDGFFRLKCLVGAAVDSCELVALNGSFTGAIVSGRASNDAITAVSGGYTRAMKYGAGAPTAADCDNAGEIMRTYYDTTNHFHYVCEGAGGWYKSGVYAP